MPGLMQQALVLSRLLAPGLGLGTITLSPASDLMPVTRCSTLLGVPEWNEGSPGTPDTPPAQRLVRSSNGDLRVVTLNVRGLQGNQAWHDMQALAVDYSLPDLIALTETKQKRKTTFHGPMQQLYKAHSSASDDGHAGVALL
jgi:hypothetical protein